MKEVIARIRIAVHVLRGRPLAYRLDIVSGRAFGKVPDGLMVTGCRFTV